MNSTDIYSDKSRSRGYYIQFIACYGAAAPFGLLALYIFISQVIYMIVKVASQFGKDGSSKLTSGRETCKPNKINSRGVAIIILCIISSFAAFLRVVIDLRFVYGRHEDVSCTVALRMKFLTYGIGIIAIYVVLWLRQRTFYEDPKLNHLSTVFIRFLSWFTAIAFILISSTALVLFLAFVNYLGTPYGCILDRNALAISSWALLFVITFLFQICFLSLFIYPLIKHNQTMKWARDSGSPDNSMTVITLIKRSTVTALICIASDIICALTGPFLDPYGSVGLFIYEVNIVVNILSLILSFTNWRERLMPWRLMKNQEDVTPGKSESGTEHTMDI